MSTTTPSKARTSVRRHLLMSAAGVSLLVFGLGGLAVGTELAGAVVAAGIVAVEGSVKKVQHPTGGVVGEIHVRDGDRVKAGDVVIRLDETVARANLAMITKSLDELTARKARLEAERDGKAEVGFRRSLPRVHPIPTWLEPFSEKVVSFGPGASPAMGSEPSFGNAWRNYVNRSTGPIYNPKRKPTRSG